MSTASKDDRPKGIARFLTKLFSKSGDYQRRYGRAGGSNSVDYRRNRRDLHQGRVAPYYEDVARLIPGDSVVDIGAGEGILALTLAQTKARVRAIDITPRRHESGLALREDWGKLGRRVENCEMVLGNAVEDLALLDGFDTLIASRVIYYFGDAIEPFMSEAARRVKHVVLIGNPGRNRRYARGKAPADIGENVVYSTPEGMTALLERHGFDVELKTGLRDPVAIGTRKGG
jgi:SAM-dependent methyltransferase